MRKLLLILAIFVPAWLFAGDLIIHKNNGSQVTVPMADIQKITFTTSKLETLVQMMSGSFSSQAQADTSSDPYHFDVRLKMRRIWPERTDGYWLYVEQAYQESQNSPYRQRIYKVFEANGQLQDFIYGIPNQASYVGAWNNPAAFNNLTPEQLTLKPNCGLLFNDLGDHFAGATQGTGCTATIPGVAYLTSESTIYSTYLTSWDLGYNSQGVCVMGPYSPYKFDKVEAFPIK